MTTTYTFVNATAARLFAKWWNRKWARPAVVDGHTVQMQCPEGVGLNECFYWSAESFNAGAEAAEQIAKGEISDDKR